MTAVGIARPIAHGQEMTSTAMLCINASRMLISNTKAEIKKVISEMPSTTGTKMALILSANC